MKLLPAPFTPGRGSVWADGRQGTINRPQDAQHLGIDDLQELPYAQTFGWPRIFIWRELNRGGSLPLPNGWQRPAK